MKLRELRREPRTTRAADILAQKDTGASQSLNERLGVVEELSLPPDKTLPYYVVDDLIILFPEKRTELLKAVEWNKLKEYCEAPFDSLHPDQLNILFFIKRFNPGLFHTIQIPREKIREYKQALRNLAGVSSMQNILSMLICFEKVFPKEKMGKEKWLARAAEVLFGTNESDLDFELAYYYTQLVPQDREKVRDIVLRNLDSIKQKSRPALGDRSLKIKKLARLKVLLAKEVDVTRDGELGIVEKSPVSQSPELPPRPQF